jgi:hypothetical protein
MKEGKKSIVGFILFFQQPRIMKVAFVPHSKIWGIILVSEPAGMRYYISGQIRHLRLTHQKRVAISFTFKSFIRQVSDPIGRGLFGGNKSKAANKTGSLDVPEHVPEFMHPSRLFRPQLSKQEKAEEELGSIRVSVFFTACSARRRRRKLHHNNIDSRRLRSSCIAMDWWRSRMSQWDQYWAMIGWP